MTGFYRAAALSPTEIEAFEARASEYQSRDVSLKPGEIVSLSTVLPADVLRDFFDEEKIRIYREYLRTPVRSVALEIATAAGYSSEPLSPAQFEQLVQVLANADLTYQSGGNTDPVTIDWNKAASEAKNVLSTIQSNLAEGIIHQQQFLRSVKNAQRNDRAISASSEPSDREEFLP